MNNQTNMHSLTVTNVIATGAAFAIKHGTGESCYIPATVMHVSNKKPGDVILASLIDNPNEFVKERTPYMVNYIELKAQQLELPLDEPNQPPQPATRQDIYAFVRDRMLKGGVWTVAEMFKEYMDDDDAAGTVHSFEYVAVRDALRSEFEKGNCAKWSLYSSSNNTKSSKDWYSCYPAAVDVAEFAE